AAAGNCRIGQPWAASYHGRAAAPHVGFDDGRAVASALALPAVAKTPPVAQHPACRSGTYVDAASPSEQAGSRRTAARTIAVEYFSRPAGTAIGFSPAVSFFGSASRNGSDAGRPSYITVSWGSSPGWSHVAGFNLLCDDSPLDSRDRAWAGGDGQ